MIAPGPTAAELREIIAVAARTPDHGKLAPWRFVHVGEAQRPDFAELLHRAFRVGNPEPSRLEIEAVNRLAHQAPDMVIAISSPIHGHKIALWEQQLSCGAACMNLLLAAHALGYVGGWITGWAAYSPMVQDAFCREGEQIAGFLFLGTPAHPLEERPRPAMDFVLSEWHPS